MIPSTLPREFRARCRVSSRSKLRSDLPEVRKHRPPNGFLQIRHPRRAAGPAFGADCPFHHLHMAIAPLLDAFVEVHEPLAQLRILRIATLERDEELLDLP